LRSSSPEIEIQENLELPRLRLEQVGFSNNPAWQKALSDVTAAKAAIESNRNTLIDKALDKDKTPKRSNRGPYLSLTTTNTLPNLSTGMGSMQTESGLLVVDQLQVPSESDDLFTNGSIGIDKVRMSVPLFLGNVSIDMMIAKLLGKLDNDNEGKVVIPDFPHVYIRWDSYRQKLILTFVLD
jgi:hypothetical protein